MARKLLYLLLVLLPAALCAQPRPADSSPSTPRFALKTNAVYWATSTPNLAFEAALGKKLTLDVLGGYNPFTFSDNKKLKHWLVQPELRWWLCERFNGSFIGVHLHGGMFNVGGVDFPFGAFPALEKYRYEGEFYGGGVGFGHHWILGKRWSLEAEIGVGATRFHYDKYDCPKCGEWKGKDTKTYLSVTRAALSIIYIIK